MLDIALFRDATQGSVTLKESQRRRYKDPATIDKVVAVDAEWRKAQFLTEQLRKLTNLASKAIADKKKAKEADGTADPFSDEIRGKVTGGTLAAEDLPALSVLQLKELSKFIQERVPIVEKEAEELTAQRDAIVHEIGNIVHESVPVSDNEDNNRIERTFGTMLPKEGRLNHVDLMEKLGMMDTTERVTKMAGGRAYVLKGQLVLLQLALSNYAMQFLAARGYDAFYPPFFLNKSAMGEVAQLSQFDDELYKVTGDGDDKYLIATSEQAICAYHKDKWFAELPTPIKYAGFSSCFRKEVGSHGRDTTGIFRVHQFDKVEQFVVCSGRDDESWKALESMIQTSEEFYQSLGLPYRVINIVSGALNNAAAKKYDLEAWFPASQTFRELVSCSNCTDYQSRRLNCRIGSSTRNTAANTVKEHPHMLNGTLCALTRTMCCICENFQTETGITIPEVLRPFMMNISELKWSTEVAASAATAAPAATAGKK